MSNYPTADLEAPVLVPVAVIAVELGETVDWVANRFGEAVVVDDIGLRAVPADVARQFFVERAEWWARHEEDARRRAEEVERKRAVVDVNGLPGKEGMTPFEVMMSADEYTSFNDEYGRPKPTFLEDALAEGQRDLAERRARRSERAAAKLKEDVR